MAMQSGIVYGRLIVGQAKQIVRSFVVKGLAPTQSFRLVTAYCGFAKLNSNQPKKKFLYGEDSFFIAENKFANVLGKYFLLSNFANVRLIKGVEYEVTTFVFSMLVTVTLLWIRAGMGALNASLQQLHRITYIYLESVRIILKLERQMFHLLIGVWQE